MYQILIYAITPNLWRWEIRDSCGLLRSGTAHTGRRAKREAKQCVAD
jgi:hypothetical protein